MTSVDIEPISNGRLSELKDFVRESAAFYHKLHTQRGRVAIATSNPRAVLNRFEGTPSYRDLCHMAEVEFGVPLDPIYEEGKKREFRGAAFARLADHTIPPGLKPDEYYIPASGTLAIWQKLHEAPDERIVMFPFGDLTLNKLSVPDALVVRDRPTTSGGLTITPIEKTSANTLLDRRLGQGYDVKAKDIIRGIEFRKFRGLFKSRRWILYGLSSTPLRRAVLALFPQIQYLEAPLGYDDFKNFINDTYTRRWINSQGQTLREIQITAQQSILQQIEQRPAQLKGI
ncbi:MAG: hypothetical protein Q7S88_01775 [Candidatus Daviesbacteria bacterium]|nr:hypothetical protein [Candidatus Daviesbacteria bacterium]